MGLRAENKERRRRRILSEARALIERDGSDGWSMRKVAEAAGLSVTTLYNLYGSKDEIRLALIRDLLDGIDEALAEIPLERPLERAHAVITVGVEHVTRECAITRPGLLASQESELSGADFAAPRAVEMQRVAIAAAMRDGLLRQELRPELLAAQVYDGFQRAMLLWACGALDTAGFRSKALYSLYVCLLGVATEETRPRILEALHGLEPRLARRKRRAA